eukprot:5136779-Prymnesium_polylepis.1
MKRRPESTPSRLRRNSSINDNSVKTDASEGDLLAKSDAPRALRRARANFWTEPRICGRARYHAACRTAGQADRSRRPRLEAAKLRAVAASA